MISSALTIITADRKEPVRNGALAHHVSGKPIRMRPSTISLPGSADILVLTWPAFDARPTPRIIHKELIPPAVLDTMEWAWNTPHFPESGGPRRASRRRVGCQGGAGLRSRRHSLPRDHHPAFRRGGRAGPRGCPGGHRAGSGLGRARHRRPGPAVQEARCRQLRPLDDGNASQSLAGGASPARASACASSLPTYRASCARLWPSR